MNERRTIVALLTVIAAALVMNVVVMGSRSAEAQVEVEGADGEPYVTAHLPTSLGGFSRVWSDGQIDYWSVPQSSCTVTFSQVIIGPAHHPFPVVSASGDGNKWTEVFEDGRVDMIGHVGGGVYSRCTVEGLGGSACIGDTDRNGEIEFEDILNVLAQWGTCTE